MASEAKTASMKQLKVDNWGTFFMQRLQLLFAKGDSCDLTLKFSTGQELKVHSLVIRTCTSHFDSLPRVENMITLPESLSYNAVFPIINFMYSGKLEFKPELHAQLLAVVKILNITILSKLLSTAQKADVTGPIGVKTKPLNLTTESNNKTPSQQLVLQQTTPTSSYSLFSAKKLPFWRKRTLPFLRFRKPIEEEPGPIRFIWPENESTELLIISSPSFVPLTYESEPIIKGIIKEEEKEVERAIAPQRRVIESRLLTTHDSDDDDDDHFEASYSSDEEAAPIPPPPTPPPPTPILKPCLKTSPPADTETTGTPATKKVRFSLGPEGKENTVQSASNHARIIAEVLKKYPDLVKNKNIKLKISSPRPKVENGAVNAEGKASYVVLRPTVKPTPNTLAKPNDLVGPWTCEHCPDLKFEDYFNFRRHLQETHNERLDARVCEYCGYKASKRNLHLYHLFTKHNVPPPKNINFPKCTECDYIALSDSLLSKHANSHQMRCDICKISLKSLVALQAHKVTCKPGNEPRNIICDLCKKAFRTNISLNAHLKECQGKPEDDANIFGDEADQQPVEMIEVPIIGTVDVEKNEHALVQIPSGIILTENQNMATLLPSSESEGLNNVATGIATSIGLTVSLPQDQQTVILLEGNSDFFLQGNEPIVVHKHSAQEYIVPELLDSSFTSATNITYAGTDQVIYLGSSTSNAHREVIHLGEIKLNQPRPGTSSSEDKVIVHQKVSSDRNSENSTEQCLEVNKQVLVGQSITLIDNEQVTHEESESSISDVENTDKSGVQSTIDYDHKNHSKPHASIEGKVNKSKQFKFEENNNGSQTLISNVDLRKSGSEALNINEPKCDENNDVAKLPVKTLGAKTGRSILLDDQETTHNSEKQTQQLKEHIISLNTEESQSETEREPFNLPSERMQIDEVREEMIVDENKDEEMDVEENLDFRSTKDAMDVEETEKTGDEKVDSLVKDWGFDDEETEEVIDDPDCKPLRPEIDIPL